MKRREFIKTASLTTGGVVSGMLAQRSAFGADANRPPNVLFILCDQWRFSAFSHETDPLVRTPNIDRFAAQGARFTRAYATNPVCSPNRTIIMTGRYSHQTGMINNNLMIPPTERCIGEVFRDAGYATHYIGKWHMDGEDKPGYVPPGWRRRGFETFEGFNRGHYYPQGAKYFTNDGEFREPDVYEPTYQADLAIDFMKRQHAAGKPFYCYLSWGPPHTPYRPPDGFDRYDPATLEYRPNVPKALREGKVLPRELAGYYGLCESLDHEMGRVLAALDQMGAADNTLVVFTSDHGDMHGSHGQYRKGKPEEESLHVPLMMRLPGRINPGQTPDTLIASLDLYPTLTSICGLQAPSRCMGRDLSSVVLRGESPQVDWVYCQGQMNGRRAPAARGKKAADSDGGPPRADWRCLVTPQHKLVTIFTGQVTHLFDLAADPYEMNNMANDRLHAALQKDLLAKMKRISREVDDPFPDAATPSKKMYSDVEAAAARA